MSEYPDNPNEIIEDEARSAFIESPGGHRQQIQFNNPLGCIMLHHEHHSPETIMEIAKKIGAIYEDKYIILMGDGPPFLYTEIELRKLLHP